MVAVFCARCGVQGEANDAFCVACGASLRRPASAAASAATTSSDDRVVFQHALTLLARGDAATAKTVLQRLVDERPEWAVARAYLGIACLRLIQVAEARDHCEEAVRRAPESFIVRTKYAEFLAKLGFYDQAVTQCDAALAVAAPDPSSELAARELREFSRQKAKGIFYRQVASPSRIRLGNLLPRRFNRQASQTNSVERGL